MIIFFSQDRSLRIALVILPLLVLLIFLAGCVSEHGKIANNETPATPLSTSVPLTPQKLYIKAGQFENFSYMGHTIAFNYISAYPSQKFSVTVDGSEKIIQKELADNPRGIDWSEGNLGFTLKPVVWENRDGQNIPLYESTWNTTEVYFVARIIAPISQIPGGSRL
jgi:hypothetical protein